METRAKQYETKQRPSYPQITTLPVASPTLSTSSSTASSAFQSSSSLAAYPSPRSAHPHSAFSPSAPPMYGQPANAFSSAPLPSPLAAQQSGNYFGSIASASLAPGHARQIHAEQSIQANQQSVSAQQQYVGQRGVSGGTPETAPFLNNFNLVAEAAKRAQMACLMRDLGDVEL